MHWCKSTLLCTSLARLSAPPSEWIYRLTSKSTSSFQLSSSRWMCRESLVVCYKYQTKVIFITWWRCRHFAETHHASRIQAGSLRFTSCKHQTILTYLWINGLKIRRCNRYHGTTRSYTKQFTRKPLIRCRPTLIDQNSATNLAIERRYDI